MRPLREAGQDVLDTLRRLGVCSTSEVVEDTGRCRHEVYRILHRLVARGLAVRAGRYRARGTPGVLWCST